jgi:hypothetical protein
MLISLAAPSTCCTYPIAVKQTIVQEGYSTPRNIKPVALPNKLQPHQIYQLKKIVDDNNTCTGGAAATTSNNVIPTSRSWCHNEGGG